MRIDSWSERRWATGLLEPNYLPHANEIRLTKGDDTYQAGDAGERVLGLGGNDVIFGGGGEDILQGGAGNDRLSGDDLPRDASKDTLFGGDGDDAMQGGGGNDQLFGGNGDDQLNGGSGADILEGGAGNDIIDMGTDRHGNPDGKRDIVVYTSLSDGRDWLSHFVTGEDRIDLSRIDADSTTPGNDAFHFTNGRAFSGTPGELRINAADGSIQADVNGDGQADLEIAFPFVDPSRDFHARDFIL